MRMADCLRNERPIAARSTKPSGGASIGDSNLKESEQRRGKEKRNERERGEIEEESPRGVRREEERETARDEDPLRNYVHVGVPARFFP